MPPAFLALGRLAPYLALLWGVKRGYILSFCILSVDTYVLVGASYSDSQRRHMEQIDAEKSSTNQILEHLGYTTQSADFGKKRILKDGILVGEFTAWDCGKYLKRAHPELWPSTTEAHGAS